MINKIKNFHQDEQGDIIQTGIVLGIMAVIALGAMMFLRTPIGNLFRRAAGEIDAASGFDAGL